MKIDFEGQVVLVTGGTRGIGAQLVADYAALGAEVIVTGTDPERMAVLEREPHAGERGRRHHHAVDFNDSSSLSRFFEVLQAYERIDVCVNNAGINRINPIERTRLEDWEALFRVNLNAPLLLTREISAGMMARGYGRIVNISSIFGVISKPKRVLYSTTKFGLRGLTVASALDLAPYGVLVNAVSPGFVQTELTERILSGTEIEELSAQVPVRRFARPEEISRVVLFLTSRLNTYITGQNIVADGGFVNV